MKATAATRSHDVVMSSVDCVIQLTELTINS
jgi:hypothetical protein